MFGELKGLELYVLII